MVEFRKIGKYKYQLTKGVYYSTGINGFLGGDKYDYVFINTAGTITLRRGYCWDGCSGPTWDDKKNMLAGLIHDGLYQLLRLEVIPYKKVDEVDKLFHKILLDSGMSRFRAWYYYRGVNNWFAHRSAK